MTPRKAGALVMIFPVMLAAALLWDDRGSGRPFQGLLSPFDVAIAAAGALALLAGWRRFLPGYAIEPNRWGLVMGMAGVGVYLGGSVDSILAFHWIGAAVLYLGGVFYLGGKYPFVVSLPAVLGGLGILSGFAQMPILGPLLGVFLGLYGMLALAISGSADKGARCGHCEEHSGRLEAFCSYCGRILSVPSVRLSRRKAGIVISASLAILLLAQVQLVALKASPSGIYYATYSMTGAQAHPLLSSIPSGWNQANVAQETTPVVAATYALVNPHSNATLLVALSTYGVPSGFYGNVTQVSIAANESLPRYGLQTRAATSLEGLAYSAPISFLSGQQVTQGSISVLVTEPESSYLATGGRDLTPVASSVVAGLESPIFWSFALSTVGSYAFQYEPYAIPSLGLVCLLMLAGSLRGRELREGRVADSAFGLSNREFSLYATLSRFASLQTGAALDAALSAKGVAIAGDICDELRKMERLGLMRSHIRARGRIPRLLWSCELA